MIMMNQLLSYTYEKSPSIHAALLTWKTESYTPQKAKLKFCFNICLCMLLLLLLFFSSYLSPSPHAHFDTLLMLPIALTVFCWRPVLFTFSYFRVCSWGITYNIRFLAVVKPAIMFIAGTHRRRRPLNLFFAHFAAAVAPTLQVVQTHGLHAAAIAISTRRTTIRPTACGVATCTHDSNDLFVRLVRLSHYLI